MTMKKDIKDIYGYKNIDGLISGVRGQRAFPTTGFRDSGPFLMLDHIGPEKVGKDFFLNGEGHDHPHRGFETLTFMFEGRMEHRDSLGNRTTLRSGSVQRMNAGSGIIHGGDMAADPETGRFHEVQLWIDNPTGEKMSTPDVQNLAFEEIPVLREGNHQLRIIAGGLNGEQGKIRSKADTQVGHFIADGPGSMTIGKFPDDYKVMAYVLEGGVSIHGTAIQQFQMAAFHAEGDTIEIETEGSPQVLILSGKPLAQPVVFGGPFVMNTQQEIDQANMDYRNGAFGTIPHPINQN